MKYFQERRADSEAEFFRVVVFFEHGYDDCRTSKEYVFNTEDEVIDFVNKLLVTAKINRHEPDFVEAAFMLGMSENGVRVFYENTFEVDVFGFDLKACYDGHKVFQCVGFMSVELELPLDKRGLLSA